jgi:ABC-type lipoprotein export system ATPase subunit
MIELRDVRRTYRKGIEEIRALDGASLTIERGELVAIVGPSGSGKSTLMNIVGLLDRPDSGTYLLEGRDAAELSPNERARIRNERIGFVFQAFHLLPRATAVENVELPLVYAERSVAPGRGMRTLERVGLADRATHYPGELSGGQQQRVAIARALVQEPDVVLADEPTGNLDAQAGGEIIEIFRHLNHQGTTVVIITHNEEVARRAGRTIAIVEGRIRSDARRPIGIALAGGVAR